MIGAVESFACGDLHTTLRRYIGQNPEVEIRVVENRTARLRADLAARRLDLIFLPGAAHANVLDAAIIREERVTAALPSLHRLAEVEPLRWGDLAEERILIRKRDVGTEVHALLTAHLLSDARMPRFSRQDVGRDTLLHLVSAGLGIHVLTEAACQPAPGVVFSILHDADGPTRVAFSAHWLAVNDNPCLRRFLDMLREAR